MISTIASLKNTISASLVAFLDWCIHKSIKPTLSISWNNLNPTWGIATISHQARCMGWGHQSLFHAASSLLNWYKMACMTNMLHRLIWVKFMSMLSMWMHNLGHTCIFICRIKTGSGGVCCHNARGRVRNRKSNPDGVAGGIWRTVRTSPSALWQQTPTDRS